MVYSSILNHSCAQEQAILASDNENSGFLFSNSAKRHFSNTDD
jgi:hypothetical protein